MTAPSYESGRTALMLNERNRPVIPVIAGMIWR